MQNTHAHAQHTHLLLKLQQPRTRLDGVHAQVVGHDVVVGRLELVVADVLLRLADRVDVIDRLVVVVRLRHHQLRPLQAARNTRTFVNVT